jgi:hypothetical protein
LTDKAAHAYLTDITRASHAALEAMSAIPQREAGSGHQWIMRKRFNADQKRARRSADVRQFMAQYGRRAHKGHDPNDRSYDREIERSVRGMDPIELDRLMREDED